VSYSDNHFVIDNFRKKTHNETYNIILFVLQSFSKAAKTDRIHSKVCATSTCEVNVTYLRDGDSVVW